VWTNDFADIIRYADKTGSRNRDELVTALR
jgi:hypothetical protein